MPDAKNKTTALIIGRGLLTVEAIASELRERLAKEIGESYRFIGEIELLRRARRILAEFEPILAENIAQTDLAGWIAGFDEVAKKLPPDVESLFKRLIIGGPPRPPSALVIPGFGDDEPIVHFPLIEKAAESLFARRILRNADFDAASAAEKAKAFTVAGDITQDTLTTIRDVMAETVQQGASLEAFRTNLGDRLQTSFAGPGHLENVFRTNVQASFIDGGDTLAENPIVAEVLPYARYDAIHDARCRPQHLALEGYGIEGSNIYRAADPFWQVFNPPWSWQCRCAKTFITLEAAARGGLSEAREWIRTGQRPSLMSMLSKIPFRPPAGFGARRVAA